MIILGLILNLFAKLLSGGATVFYVSLSDKLSTSNLYVTIITYYLCIALMIAGLVVFFVGIYKAFKKNKANSAEVQIKNYPVSLNIATYIVLSIITLGVFYIYWEYLLVKNVRALKNDESSYTGEMLCLIFVPFYNLYWWYTRGKVVKDELSKRGYNASGNEIAYLVLGLFGLGIVSAAIMQNDYNSFNKTNQQINNNSLTSKELCFLSLGFSALGIILSNIYLISIPFFIVSIITGYKAKQKALADKEINNELANQCFIAAIIGLVCVLLLLLFSVWTNIQIEQLKNSTSLVY